MAEAESKYRELNVVFLRKPCRPESLIREVSGQKVKLISHSSWLTCAVFATSCCPLLPFVALVTLAVCGLT